MDHSEPFDGDENDNVTTPNTFSVRSQLNMGYDTTTGSHPSPSNVFLVPISGDDTMYHHHHHHHPTHPESQNPPPEYGNDSASTIDDAFLSNHHHHHLSRNNCDHMYETASSSDGTMQQHYHPHPNTLSSYSAPTDEEEAYYNRYNTTTGSRNQTSQCITAMDVGTTLTNPILLHTVDMGTNDDVTPATTSANHPSRTANINSVDPDIPLIPDSSKISFPTPSTDDWNDNNCKSDNMKRNSTNDTGGGRLWRLAGEVAAGRITLLSLDPHGNVMPNGGGPVRQLKESFMERMRSRADPDAIFVTTSLYSSGGGTIQPTTSIGGGGGGGTHTNPYHDYAGLASNVNTHSRMLKMPVVLSSSSLSNIPPQQQQFSTSTDTDDALYREDEAFLINTGLAQRRVRVVQLMIIGLFGILLPWMGNVFVSSNCHFASIHVVVGSYGNVYPLHFGLWNYSPVSSALNGYKYCYPYYHQSSANDEDYSMNQYRSDPPITSRICNSFALLLGTYSLVILWWYLISGRVRRHLWKGAVYAAFMAGMLQLATPISFFLGRTCRNNHCSVGPGTVLCTITAIGWMVFGAELHYHCPIIHYLQDGDDHHLDNTLDRKASSQPNTTSAENYYLWNDVRSNRQHSNHASSSSSSHPVDVSQLEMSDFTSASQQYFHRFYPYRSCTGTQYNPPDIS
jgi:hypothetical protein